jgi:hypothetical protein
VPLGVEIAVLMLITYGLGLGLGWLLFKGRT